MKNTKKELENSILVIAEFLGQKENYSALLKEYPGVPKIIEMLI